MGSPHHPRHHQAHEVAWRDRTPEQIADVQTWLAARSRLIEANASIVVWGCIEDEPGCAVGVRLAHGDWDKPTDFGQRMSDFMSDESFDPDARVAELCAWLGIEPQPCTLLLLSSYS